MSETMTAHKHGQFAQKTRQDYFSEFAIRVRMAWTSAELMMHDLSKAGIELSRATCVQYRNGQSEPRFTRGEAILDLADAKLEQDIAERKARLDARRRRRNA